MSNFTWTSGLAATFIAFSPLCYGQTSTQGVEFDLKGVIISTNSRLALVGGSILEEGAYFDGIQILSIEAATVRVLSGDNERVLPVGSRSRLVPSTVASADSRVAEHRSAKRRVRSGETLSGIAEDYASGGLSRLQVMIAIFDANPEAFDGNVNRLKAGAHLRIPDATNIRRYSMAMATTEVLRQTATWKDGATGSPASSNPSRFSQPSPVDDRAANGATAYGPVEVGETLSEIAVHIADRHGHGVAMNKVMSALFAANPHAFGASADVLREGSVLMIPEFRETADQFSASGERRRETSPASIAAKYVRTLSAVRNEELMTPPNLQVMPRQDLFAIPL